MMNLTFRVSLVVLTLASGAVVIACSGSDDGGGDGNGTANPTAAGNEAGTTTGSSGSSGGSSSSSGGSSSGAAPGNSALCTEKSSCASDPAPAKSAIDTCSAAISDSSCGAKYEAFVTCANKNRKCTAAGKTDPLPTAAACKTEAKDYSSCKGPVDAGKG